MQEFADAEDANGVLRGQQFAGLGTLAVAEVDRVGLEVACGQGGADDGVHASGEADHGAGTNGVGHSLESSSGSVLSGVPRISRAVASSCLWTRRRARKAAPNKLFAFSPCRKHSIPADSRMPLAMWASTESMYLPTVTNLSGSTPASDCAIGRVMVGSVFTSSRRIAGGR